jgi:hypothetical protein
MRNQGVTVLRRDPFFRSTLEAYSRQSTADSTKSLQPAVYSPQQ